jgi:hypothetical protein
MIREVVFEEQFENDVEEACGYYRNISEKLELELLTTLRELLKRISLNPMLFARVKGEFRQKKCGLIIYKVTTSKTCFIAFFQAQQNPINKTRKKKSN